MTYLTSTLISGRSRHGSKRFKLENYSTRRDLSKASKIIGIRHRDRLRQALEVSCPICAAASTPATVSGRCCCCVDQIEKKEKQMKQADGDGDSLRWWRWLARVKQKEKEENAVGRPSEKEERKRQGRGRLSEPKSREKCKGRRLPHMANLIGK